MMFRRSRLLLLGMIAAWGCTAPAQSEISKYSGQPGVDALIGNSFLPDHRDARLLREHAMAGELAQTLSELPGMKQVRVHLSLADRSLIAADSQLPTTVTVVATHSASGRPSETMIRQIAAAAVPGVMADRIRVFLSKPEKTVQETVHVGPIEVVSTSAQTMKIWLGGLLVLCALLAGGLIAAGVTLRKLHIRQ